MKIASRIVSPRRRQAGMSLFPALMFLLVLAVLGISALTALSCRKRWSPTPRIPIWRSRPPRRRFATPRPTSSATTLSGRRLASLRPAPAAFAIRPSTWPTPVSLDISKAIDWSNGALTRPYGSQTAAPALPDVATQPVYVIERIPPPPGLPATPGASVGMGCGAACPPASAGFAYRLTVLATGARLETRVVLQSTYIVRNS